MIVCLFWWSGATATVMAAQLMAEGDIQLMLLMRCSGWSTTSSLWDEMAPGIRLSVCVCGGQKPKRLYCGSLVSTVKRDIISSWLPFFDWSLAAVCEQLLGICPFIQCLHTSIQLNSLFRHVTAYTSHHCFAKHGSLLRPLN